MKLFLLAVCLGAVTLPVSAQVYRCVVNDAVTISTQPCPTGAKVTEFKPEPGAAEREAAAKKAADEEVARMKEKVSLLERERREREAILDATRREQEIRSVESAPAGEPVREEGIVERTVIMPVVPQLYPYQNPHPDYRPPHPPHRPNPPVSGNRPGKPNESVGAFRPGKIADPDKEPVASPATPGKVAAAKAPGKAGATGKADLGKGGKP